MNIFCPSKELNFVDKLVFALPRRLVAMAMPMVVLCAFQARADLLVEDAFTGPVGSLVGNAPATGATWSAVNSHSDTIAITAGSLISPAGLFPASGNKLSWALAGEDAVTTFESRTTGTIFYSFLINLATNTTTTSGVNLMSLGSSPTAHAASFAVRRDPVDSTKFNAGFFARSTFSGPSFSSEALTVGTTYFVVVAYDFVPGSGNDLIRFWVNPIASTFGGDAPLPALSVVSTFGDLSGISSLYLWQRDSTNPSLSVDELRVGTTWAAVTRPDPNTLPPSGSVFQSVRGNLNVGTSADPGVLTIQGPTGPTTTPSLSVMGDGGAVFGGTFGSGAQIPQAGIGTRLMWVPTKSAFVGGTTTDPSLWTAANMGNYSFSFGKDTEASGDEAFAIGGGAAVGNHSSAIGRVTASAYGSVVVGSFNAKFNPTQGDQSSDSWVETDELFVVGNGTGDVNDPPQTQRRDAFVIFKNGNAHIYGDLLVSGRIGSLDLGEPSSAIAFTGGAAFGDNSVAMAGGVADASRSVAIGGSAFGEDSVSIGSGEAHGTHSVALSFGEAVGNSAVAIGGIAFGSDSVAVGGDAYGDGSIAVGGGSLTFGIGSTALSNSYAGGDYSTAMSSGTVTDGGSGQTAISGGTAIGDFSVAVGRGVESPSAYSVALGSFNADSAVSELESWVAEEPIMVVGNGQSPTARSNALEVRKNGNLRTGGNVEARGVIRCAPGGDLDMGAFTAGVDPRDLDSALKYPGEYE